MIVDGKERKSLCVPSREEALALIAKFTKEPERSKAQTIGMALQEFRTHMIEVRRVLPQTAHDVHDALARWFPIAQLATSLTCEKAQRLYENLAQTVSLKTGKALSASTHHHLLKYAKSWGKWAHRERLTSVNPFADVAPVGKRRSGKAQLRIDEAKQLADTMQVLANEGDSGALGLLLMLHLGLRQDEVGARIARDVDAKGTILWITSGKTANAVRRLKVPECLRAPLIALASRKQPDQFLFSDGLTQRRRSYFWDKLHRFCEQANVPQVCPHSLRGLHATLALEAGATSSMVAHALGHGSFAITARHYASADSVEGSRVARVSEALGTSDDSVSRLLTGLSPKQLEELKKRLG